MRSIMRNLLNAERSRQSAIGDERKAEKENNKYTPEIKKKYRERMVCSFWIKDKCKFGYRCKNEHPLLCEIIMEKGICQKACGRFHPRICNAMKQNGFCSKGQRCNYTHFRDTGNSVMNNKAYSQSNHYESQHNTNTFNRKPNYNQQRPHNTINTNRYNDNFNEYNQMSEPNMDFYMHPNTKWQAINKPLMERAAEILAENMMWNIR